MTPQPHYTNGDEEEGGSDGSSSSGEADAEAEELSLVDAEAPARALAALNALRKSRQHYDVVLVAAGVEVPAHRAVLAAASPYLLEALQPSSPPAPAPSPGAAPSPGVAPAPAPPQPQPYRVEEVDGEALRALVEYLYTGRLEARSAGAARRLYLAAWRLRVEAARAHLAERLARPRRARLRPRSALAARALPALSPAQLHHLDAYIADNFEEVCESGALATLPQIRIEVMREEAAAGAAAGAGGEDAPLTVADAALAWLQEQAATDRDFSELCSRTHLVFVDGSGALRDCGELPQAEGDAPELQQYRREARARRREAGAGGGGGGGGGGAARALPGLALGARAAAAECAVLAARRVPGGATTALLAVRGRLAAARALWRAGGAGGAGGEPRGAARPLRLSAGRCALGAAAVGADRLLVCGGYDRARVLREAELYAVGASAWAAAPEMRRARARCPAARLRGRVYLLGGSDGHAELDSVEAYCDASGRWEGAARLPLAVAHAAAAADEERGELYVAGGWAAGGYLRHVWKYRPDADAWTEEPPLRTGRAQCAGVWWGGAVWVVGGCDAWHCLASCERLPVGEGEAARWTAGPALPSARRSVGACAWRGRLVVCGGSDGATSLRRTDWLPPDWAPPPHPPHPPADSHAADADPGAGAGAWEAGPMLRAARAGAGLAVVQDVLYAAGGFDGKEFLACAEYLAAPHAHWTQLCAPPRVPPPPPCVPPPARQEASDSRKPAAAESGAPEGAGGAGGAGDPAGAAGAAGAH